MADLTPVIETMENRWMRAWVNRDLKALKGLTASDFILLTGSKPPAILDRPSWLEAASKRYDCSSYRFADIYVRQFGSSALFCARLEMKATMDGQDRSGTVWLSDIWRKGRVRRSNWKLVQRILSKPDDDPSLAKSIRALQLWK
jgi:ketosteroid isomerase-like protein